MPHNFILDQLFRRGYDSPHVRIAVDSLGFEVPGRRLRRLFAGQAFSSRNAAVRAVCREFGFLDARGQLRIRSCGAALAALERAGAAFPPLPRAGGGGGGRPRRLGAPVPPPSGVPSDVSGIAGLRLVPADGPEDRLAWNEIMAREHPRGAVSHAGPQLRYLLVSEHGVLGGLGFSAPAFRLAARDRWIGWDEDKRARCLNHAVICLSRFLIRPMTECRNLAIRALKLCFDRLGDDFERIYRFRPLLVETFVDEREHAGTAFAASGWECAGRSAGRGRFAARGDGPRPVKTIWLRPLRRDWRRRLGTEPEPLRPSGPADGLDRESWAENEFGGAPLADERLSRRLAVSAMTAADRPGESFPAAAQGDKALIKGYYRLIDQPAESAVTPENILAPHRGRTRRRAAACETVLMIQDGTDLNFASHGACRGLGIISRRKGSPGTLGLHMHSTLAVDAANGIPLGVPRIEFDAPDGGGAERDKPPGERKSARWLRGARDAAGFVPEGVNAVAVMDREADFFALFDERRRLKNIDLLVRAKVDRKIGGEKLFARLSAQPERGRALIDVPRSSARVPARGQKAAPLRQARQADVALRWEKVDIPPPADAGGTAVSLTLLSAREEAPPEGTAPPAWKLLTSLPAATAKNARRILRWYALRRRIEDWHRILKSGCKAEHLNHQEGERIERAVTVKAVIAWRLHAMVMLGRETPELPADVLFPQAEIEALRVFAESRRLKIRPGDLGSAVRIMAVKGGYIDRPKAPPPGHETLWRGCARLAADAAFLEMLADSGRLERDYRKLRPDKKDGDR